MSRAALMSKTETAEPKAKAPTGASLRIGEVDDAYEQEADRVADQVVSREGQKFGWSLSRIGMAAPLQRKLTIGSSNDPLEMEADRVADHIMAKPNDTAVGYAPYRIQRFTGAAVAESTAPASVDRVLANSGRPLDSALRKDMEHRFGYDFSTVRVHTSSAAEQSARDVNAHAYTVGSNIVFGAGQFTPESHAGRKLIAHELTHVVQQSGVNESRFVPVTAGLARGIVQRDVLPMAKFSPSLGLFVDRTENSVSISGKMELYGPEANAARAASIQNTINSTWTKTFPDGHSVNCNITVTYRPPGFKAGDATQIEADNISGPSHVSPGLSGRAMTLNAKETDAFTWTPAHEFGHVIGLNDRYSEGIISEIKGSFGGERATTVQPGYEGNLMAVSGGAIESKNVKDVANENEPNPYWINDDDQVRDWVNGHSFGDVAKLSTSNKLKGIKTLMGGWISDEDVAAISRICSSVTVKADADAIRSKVDLLEMTSIGQRTMVRVAFAKMP